MKKSITNWNGNTVYNFDFVDTIDLCNYVKHARINENIFSKNKIREHGSETCDTNGWYQTKNLKEAIKLCKKGWNEGFDFFKTLKKSLEATGDRIYIFPANNDDTVNLYINLAYHHLTTKQAIVNRGVIVQNLIKQLEENYYKVNLNAFSLIYCDNEISNISVGLKGKDEQLDSKKAYFALCNPSFLRRLIFRVMESSDFKDKNWIICYGYPCNAETIRKFYQSGKLDIVIPQASEIGITGDNINEDWRRFLKYEKLQKYFNS